LQGEREDRLDPNQVVCIKYMSPPPPDERFRSWSVGGSGGRRNIESEKIKGETEKTSGDFSVCTLCGILCSADGSLRYIGVFTTQLVLKKNISIMADSSSSAGKSRGEGSDSVDGPFSAGGICPAASRG